MKTATQPKVKYLVIVKGKGTAAETRIQTTIPLHWSKEIGQYITIPE